MTTTHYIWDVANDSYLMETDGDGNPTAVYTNEPVQYGDLISQRRGSTTSYYQYDGQGSTRQLTDQNASVTDEYTYSAFGETVASSGTTVNPFRFLGSRGYFYGSETMNYYVRARHYESAITRWLSQDPQVFFQPATRLYDNHQSIVAKMEVYATLYQYVRNNPLRFLDPSGLGDIDAKYFCPQQVPKKIRKCYNWIGPVWKVAGYPSLRDCASAIYSSVTMEVVVGIGIGGILYPPIGVGAGIGGALNYPISFAVCADYLCSDCRSVVIITSRFGGEDGDC